MNKEQITLKLKKLRDKLGIESNNTITKQIVILAETLDQYYFTEKQFDNACKKIIGDTSETYNKMPIFGKFVKLMEHQFFKLKTKEEAKKDFYINQKNWVSTELSGFQRMIQDDKEGRPVFKNFINNYNDDVLKKSMIDEFKKLFLRDEEMTVDNVRKKIVNIINIYNQNQEKAIKRLKELFIEKEQEMAGILNIRPMLDFDQDKVVKILNGNI